MIGERNGTNGSWKWSRSNCSRSSMSRTWETNRGESVIVPTEPLTGSEKPLPIRMMSPSDARWRPWRRGQDPDVVAAQAEVLVEVADVLGHAAGQRVDVRRDEADLHRPVLAVGRSAAASLVEPRRPVRPPGIAEVAPRAVAPDPAADRRPARRGRTCGAAARTSPSWPAGAVEASRGGASSPARGSPPAGPSAVRPGNVVQPVPIARAAWASLLPTAAGRARAANRTTRACHGRPSVVGLNASSASGRTRGSASSRSRRRTQPWAHSGYGTSGWAGIARPPCSWISAIVVRSVRSGRTAPRGTAPSRWPPSVETSSPTMTSTAQAEVAGHRPGGDARRRSARGR